MKGKYSKLALFLTIGYLLLLSYWMLFGFGRTPNIEYMYNLIPFSTISHFLRTENFNTKTWIINLLGNIGVFVPFGILLPLIIRGRYLRNSILFLSGVFVLECIQLLTKRGHFDVDDLILNYIGFLLGYWTVMIITLWVNTRRGGIT